MLGARRSSMAEGKLPCDRRMGERALGAAPRPGGRASASDGRRPSVAGGWASTPGAPLLGPLCHAPPTRARLPGFAKCVCCKLIFHVFQMFQKNVESVSFGCYRIDLDVAMLHMFYTHVASV